MEIRDTRNGSWYWVNTAVNACPHITPADKSVYGALASLGGYKKIHPSYKEIAKRSAASIRQCKMSIKKLVEMEYVGVKIGGGKGNANVYDLLKVPKGCKICTVSKGAKNVSQTVQNLSSNGAKSAPHIDNELDKKKDSKKFNSAGGKPPTTPKAKTITTKELLYGERKNSSGKN